MVRLGRFNALKIGKKVWFSDSMVANYYHSCESIFCLRSQSSDYDDRR